MSRARYSREINTDPVPGSGRVMLPWQTAGSDTSEKTKGRRGRCIPEVECIERTEGARYKRGESFDASNCVGV